MLFMWIICSLPFLGILLAMKRVNIRIGQLPFEYNKAIIIIFSFMLICLMSANRVGYDALNFNRFWLFISEYNINPFDYTYTTLYSIASFFIRNFPGMTYPIFHSIVNTLVLILLIYPVVRNYSDCALGVLSIYVISGMFAVDGMQFKNFISVGFLLYAFMCYEDEEKSNIKFICFMLLAIAFHFSFVIYFLVPLTSSKNVREASKSLPIVGGVIYFIFFFDNGFLTKGLLTLVGSGISILSKLTEYDAMRSGKYSLVALFLYFMFLFLLEYSYSNNQDINEKKKRFHEYVLYIWRLMGVALPFLCYANASYRLFRNLYIMIFIVIINSLYRCEWKGKKIFKLLVIISIFIVFFYVFMLRQQDDVYKPVVEGFYFWEQENALNW